LYTHENPNILKNIQHVVVNVSYKKQKTKMGNLRRTRMTVNRFRQIIANPNALCTTGQIRTHPKNHRTTEFSSQRAQQQRMIHSIENLQKICINRTDLEPVLQGLFGCPKPKYPAPQFPPQVGSAKQILQIFCRFSYDGVAETIILLLETSRHLIDIQHSSSGI
jgi:hypothetical protein